MQKLASYFISGVRAYRSEIALFRHEGITAERCAILKAPPGLAWLYLADDARGEISAWESASRALDVMLRRHGREVISIPVI
jgi:hypothetical protein